MNDNGQESLLTPMQVAAFLQVKVDRVYELSWKGKLKAVKVGRLLRFRRQDLDAYVERQLTGR